MKYHFYANPNKSTANIFLVEKDCVPSICICEHPGLILNCLYREVLDNAWLSYKQQYGQNGFEDVNMNKRYNWHGMLFHHVYKVSLLPVGQISCLMVVVKNPVWLTTILKSLENCFLVTLQKTHRENNIIVTHSSSILLLLTSWINVI